MCANAKEKEMSTVTVGELVEACEIKEEWLEAIFEPEHAQNFAKHGDLKGEYWEEWALVLGFRVNDFGATEKSMFI